MTKSFSQSMEDAVDDLKFQAKKAVKGNEETNNLKSQAKRAVRSVKK